MKGVKVDSEIFKKYSQDIEFKIGKRRWIERFIAIAPSAPDACIMIDKLLNRKISELEAEFTNKKVTFKKKKMIIIEDVIANVKKVYSNVVDIKS